MKVNKQDETINRDDHIDRKYGKKGTLTREKNMRRTLSRSNSRFF
jgi:hypothetical protein